MKVLSYAGTHPASALLLASVLSCTISTGAAQTYQDLLKPNPNNWLQYSGTYDAQRHSLLNQINTAWDEKIGLVLSADAKPEMLEKLVKQAPEEDFYLLRLISEHPRSNAKTLNKLAKHPYGAIRENVARHPNADAATLAWLSRDRSQPLWYLVAFNPNTPTPLQRRLRDRLKRLGESQPSK